MFPLLFLLACGPKPADAPVAVDDAVAWLSLDLDQPRLCLSPVPDAQRLPRADRQALAAARQRLASGDGGVDLSALPQHPATDVLLGAQAALHGQDEIAREHFRDLANTYQSDPCLQQAAAYSSLRARRVDYARPYMDAALDLRPDWVDVALLDAAITTFQDPEPDAILGRLRAVALAHPDNVTAHAWLGRALARRGDADLAMPHLLAARSAGIDVDAALSTASHQVGDLETYLSVAGRAPPLPVDVRQAKDPLTAYRDSLGITNDKLEALMHTSMGDLRCELFWRQAPLTVGNFIGLATGRSPWVDAAGQTHHEALYPGTIFHRVIPEFMVQGGDPAGDGTGGPGYAFLDETMPDLRFDRPGRLAMANSGPGTNGSQWFVTETSVPHLDGKHTIFGQCDDASVDVVRAIARVARDAQDKPLSPVLLESIEFQSSGG